MAGRRRRVTRALRPNVRATPYGLQVYTKVGGRYRSQRYRFTKTLTTHAQLLETYDEQIRAWLALHQDVVEEEHPEKGTLGADVQEYLKARANMPSLEDRRRDLQAWIDVFGADRRRRTITALEIQTQAAQWLTVGPRLVQRKGKATAPRWIAVAKPLSASAVNHRLRALSNLFRVLDRKFPNPVRDVEEPTEPDAVPRAVTYVVLHKILAAMPDRSRRLKGTKHKGRRSESLAKARVEALIWTGMTPIELQRVDAADIDEDLQQVTVSARRKGKGAAGRIIPLKHVPEGMRALRRLVALGGLGHFNAGVVRRAFQRAAATAGLSRAHALYGPAFVCDRCAARDERLPPGAAARRPQGRAHHAALCARRGAADARAWDGADARCLHWNAVERARKAAKVVSEGCQRLESRRFLRRAHASGAVGHRFESCRAHQPFRKSGLFRRVTLQKEQATTSHNEPF
jgi:hypothetical protein